VIDAVKNGRGLAITPEVALEIIEDANLITRDTDRSYAIYHIMNRYSYNIGWTTNGHTGGDVPLFAFGPGKPVGMCDQPRINTVMREAIAITTIEDWNSLTGKLFVDVAKEFPQAKWKVEPRQGYRELVISLPNVTASLPLNTDLLYLNGAGPIRLGEGITVVCEYLIPGQKVKYQRAFIPQKAVEAILQK
jgi:alkaline phosphatase